MMAFTRASTIRTSCSCALLALQPDTVLKNDARVAFTCHSAARASASRQAGLHLRQHCLIMPHGCRQILQPRLRSLHRCSLVLSSHDGLHLRQHTLHKLLAICMRACVRAACYQGRFSISAAHSQSVWYDLARGKQMSLAWPLYVQLAHQAHACTHDAMCPYFALL